MTTQTQFESIANSACLLIQEVWSRDDLGFVNELVTEDAVQHVLVLSDPTQGSTALKDRVTRYRQGTPDLTKTIEERDRITWN